MANLVVQASVKNPMKDDAKVQLAEKLAITGKQHNSLLNYVLQRLNWAAISHKEKVARYTAIDKEFSGFIHLTEDDYQRKLDTEAGEGPKVYDVNLQLVKVQIDEAVTFLLSVFFPEEGPYNAIAPDEKQQIAKGFSTLMNTHSADFKHYTNTAKAMTDALKYNLGMLMPVWEEVKGTRVQNDTAQQPEILQDVVVNMGNNLQHLDPYNTLLDPSVDPVDLHKDGEFFATVDAVSTFKVKRMSMNKEIFNTDQLDFDMNQRIVMNYYHRLPDITGDAGKGNKANAEIDWLTYLSGTTGGTALGAYELIKLNIWLPAKDYGLSTLDKYELWRLTIINATYIVKAVKLNNAHGFLPIGAMRPWDDNFTNQTQSYAEILLPYQRFSSFQLNLHQHASRKALYGVTFYNQRLFPDLKDADLTSAKVPFDPAQEVEDYRKHVFQLNDVPDTSNTLQDVSNMDTLMQKILPTDMLKQVADLQRATKYQAAATVQGANRRNLKIAQTIESQAFALMRKIQVFNIMEFQQSVDIFDPQGKLVEINPSELRDSDVQIVVGAGLRGLDKMIVAESLQDILAFLVQNQQAASTFDIAAIINYITSLVGDYTDFNQFKFENEFDKLTPEQKQIAFQLLQKGLQTQSAQQGEAQAQSLEGDPNV